MSDGPDTDPAARPGRPPLPRPVPVDPEPEDTGGRQHTEQVPFPLPPLPPMTAAPDPVAGPATGQLDLGGYPPKVPGGRRPAHRDRDDDARDDG